MNILNSSTIICRKSRNSRKR